MTVQNPDTLAGAAISIDVGYSDAVPFTEYDTNNTNMVRASMHLTFSEIKADRIKKVTLKNDTANKSYFLETDEATKDNVVAVLYTQDADDADKITKAM